MVGIQQILLKWKTDVNSFVWLSILFEVKIKHTHTTWNYIILIMGRGLEAIFTLEKSAHILQGKNHDWLLTTFEIHWITAQFPILSDECGPSSTRVFFCAAPTKIIAYYFSPLCEGQQWQYSISLKCPFQMRITTEMGTANFFSFPEHSKELFSFFSCHHPGQMVDLSLHFWIMVEIFRWK